MWIKGLFVYSQLPPFICFGCHCYELLIQQKYYGTQPVKLTQWVRCLATFTVDWMFFLSNFGCASVHLSVTSAHCRPPKQTCSTLRRYWISYTCVMQKFCPTLENQQFAVKLFKMWGLWLFSSCLQHNPVSPFHLISCRHCCICHCFSVVASPWR